jgi:hypothetical protein
VSLAIRASSADAKMAGTRPAMTVEGNNVRVKRSVSVTGSCCCAVPVQRQGAKLVGPSAVHDLVGAG